MSAPDRPTREQQVDADALALIDDLFATFLIPHDDADPMHAGWTRGASVRADVAQEWRDRRAALVARTPQPADESDELHPEALERAARDLAQDVGWRWGVDPDRDARHRERATIAIRSYLRALPPAAAPLPAVPDGEDETCTCCGGDPNTVCDACGEHSCWAGVMYCEDYRTAGTRQRPVGGAS